MSTTSKSHLAGTLMKAIRLASSPGMDRIAVALNMGLTYDEQKQAERWSVAFELAERAMSLPEAERKKPLELAAELYEATR